MSVGKGSLVRASKVNTVKVDNNPVVENTSGENEPEAKIEEAVQKKQFETVSNIKSELPHYLL